jgi:hypothetical protein
VATQWVTTSNAPFSDLNKSFQAFLKTFEIASYYPVIYSVNAAFSISTNIFIAKKTIIQSFNA